LTIGKHNNRLFTVPTMKKLTAIFTLIMLMLTLAGFAGSNSINTEVDYVVCAGKSLQLDATAAGVETYLWLHSNETSPVVTIHTENLTPGIYSYTVIAGNAYGCETEATIHVKVTAIEANTDEFSALVYPNPTSGNLYYDLISLPDPMYSISLYNTSGTLVLNRNAHSTHDFATGSIDLSSVNPGIYFIHFSGTDFRSVQKVILQ